MLGGITLSGLSTRAVFIFSNILGTQELSPLFNSELSFCTPKRGYNETLPP